MSYIPKQLAEIRDQLCLEPFNAELHQALGKALLKDGDINAARAAYERSIVLDPADPWSYLYLGNLFYWQGAYVEALEQFGNAQRLAPFLAIAYVCTADAYHALGDISLAEENYERAVEIEPDDPTALDNLRRWREIRKGLSDPT